MQLAGEDYRRTIGARFCIPGAVRPRGPLSALEHIIVLAKGSHKRISCTNLPPGSVLPIISIICIASVHAAKAESIKSTEWFSSIFYPRDSRRRESNKADFTEESCMKKVVLASFLACAAIASGLPSASAQDASPATAAAPPARAAAEPAAAAARPAAAAACAAPQMAAAEYAVYNNAMTQADPKAKVAALEQYLTQFPQSAVTETVLETAMALYVAIGDAADTLYAADRLLQVNPSKIRGLYAEALIRKTQADAVTDPAAKQAALDSAASYATKGLAAPKPACMSDADFTTLKATEYPSFYSVIGYAAFNKKDSPTAIDAYKKEISVAPPDATKTPGAVLQDIYFLGGAYMQATPPDYLDCTFYASRAVAYAPDPYKAAFSPTAKYCYRKYHGADRSEE